MGTLVDYLTVACTGTSQSTFYNSSSDQRRAIDNTHTSMLVDDRRTYVLSAALPITDHSKQLVIKNLLRTGAHCTDQELEGHVISMIAGEIQFNRLLNLFSDLHKERCNNRRTRRLGRLVWDMVDEFRAIKYRSKVRKLLRHCHIPEGDDPAKAEIHRWIYGAKLVPTDIQYNPKIKARIEAKSDYEAVFKLPYDIARDIAVCVHGKDPKEFEREFVGQDGQKGKGKATRKETMRARQKTRDTNIDYNRFSLFELFMYGYRNEKDRRAVEEVIADKARELANNLALPPKVAIVADDSTSMLGAAERQFQPLAMMGCVVSVCEHSNSNVTVHRVSGVESGLFWEVGGATNLRKPFMQALLTRPDLVIVLSDGYENVRAGSLHQIMSTNAFRDSGISVLHMNPVVAAESKGNVRSLSEHSRTFGIASPDQLPMITLLGLAEQNPGLLETMFQEIEKHLRLGNYSDAKNVIRTSGQPVLA